MGKAGDHSVDCVSIMIHAVYSYHLDSPFAGMVIDFWMLKSN